MRTSIPISYLRIWCRKNHCTIGVKLTTNDVYEVDGDGFYVNLPDGSRATVNQRNVVPIVDRYPSLINTMLENYQPHLPPLLYRKQDNPKAKPQRYSFDEIAQEVESYLSLLGELNSIQKYIAVRLCESGNVSIIQLNAAINRKEQSETFGSAILRMGFCTWEQMLSACLDTEEPISTEPNQKYDSCASYELSGEILVALGKITRTQLEHAIKLKREGTKPLGEILVHMGACSAADVRRCLQAQGEIQEDTLEPVCRLGDLLLQQGRITADDLGEALRLQQAGRQSLHAVLISMGACTKAVINEFKAAYGVPVHSDGYDEGELANYLLTTQAITPRQLEEARRVQFTGRQVLGDLLVMIKACRPDDIAAALQIQEQQRKTPRFLNHGRKHIGELLINRHLVKPDQVDKAIKVQSLSRQKIGATLIGLGICSNNDFGDALEVQHSWREAVASGDDKLGQELIKDGLMEQTSLQQALELHKRIGKPLGDILVSQRLCPPEVVLGTMLRRDERRRQAFERFVADMSKPARTRSSRARTARAVGNNRDAMNEQPEKQNLVEIFTSWLKR